VPGSTFSVGVELLQDDAQAAAFEEGAEAAAVRPFSKGTYDATCDKNILHKQPDPGNRPAAESGRTLGKI